MAFDGFTVAALAKEFSDRLTGGRIYRIVQPEPDELLLTIRPEITRGGGQVRLVLSADASLPLAYLTQENRPAPEAAPTFCMLLRKHLQNGRITSVSQPGLERILRFTVEHYNEMGDLCVHTLVIELMGKHSNIILLDTDESVILDAIKHIPSSVSSVREVLPGRSYFIPETRGKRDPLCETKEGFLSGLRSDPVSVPQRLQKSYCGFSTRMAEETVFRARLSQDRSAAQLTREEGERLWEAFIGVLRPVRESRTGPGDVAGRDIQAVNSASLFRSEVPAACAEAEIGKGSASSNPGESFAAGQSASPAPVGFTPTIYYHVGAADTLAQGEPVDFCAIPLTMFRNLPSAAYESMSALIETYYREKNAVTRIRQKSADLRRIVQTILERDLHKYDLQTRQLQDTKKRDRYRLCGELLTAYAFSIPEGASSAALEDWNTGETVKVPLDPAKTPAENAQHYFDRYNRLKRTEAALAEVMGEVKDEIDQLQTIRAALDLSVTEADLAQIRQEMEESGFVHRQAPQRGKGAPRGGAKGAGAQKGSRKASRLPEAKPLHYVSSDGFDIYVGKNNLQNDELTFRTAKPGDIWFHANDRPGSHVLLRADGKAFEEIPDRAFEEAARLAAYYSTGREAGRVEVDYLEKRGVKKPSGARPGFVVYYSNYSVNVPADITGIQEVK